MATLLLFVLLFFSAALLVMVVYTIDRLNSVEKITSVLNSVVAPSPSISGMESQTMFEGLFGMPLWEAMSGKSVEGWDDASLENMKPRYRIVLQKHVEAIFDEGLLDGHQETYKHLPSNSMVVSMLRGAVESWIPQNFASGIYQIGLEWSRNEVYEAKRLRKRLDLIVDEMFSECEIELKSPLSKILLPQSDEEILRGDVDEDTEDDNESVQALAINKGENLDNVQTSDSPVSSTEEQTVKVAEDGLPKAPDTGEKINKNKDLKVPVQEQKQPSNVGQVPEPVQV
jgi:hypothetical protein